MQTNISANQYTSWMITVQ